MTDVRWKTQRNAALPYEEKRPFKMWHSCTAVEVESGEKLN